MIRVTKNSGCNAKCDIQVSKSNRMRYVSYECQVVVPSSGSIQKFTPR